METRRVFSGARLRAIRKSKGLSVERLARLSDINTNNIGRWERGDHLPLASQLPALADALEVPMDDFYENGKEAA